MKQVHNTSFYICLEILKVCICNIVKRNSNFICFIRAIQI